jgi:hypothetical protein
MSISTEVLLLAPCRCHFRVGLPRGFRVSSRNRYMRVNADKLSAAAWSWGYCGAVTEDVHISQNPVIGNYESSVLDTRYVSYHSI